MLSTTTAVGGDVEGRAERRGGVFSTTTAVGADVEGRAVGAARCWRRRVSTTAAAAPTIRQNTPTPTPACTPGSDMGSAAALVSEAASGVRLVLLSYSLRALRVAEGEGVPLAVEDCAEPDAEGTGAAAADGVGDLDWLGLGQTGSPQQIPCALS